MNAINQDAIRKKIKGMTMTQQELANKSGVPQSSISKFLAGKTITASTLEKLWPILYGDQPQQQAQGE